MRRGRPRLTVFRLILAVAVAAILVRAATFRSQSRAGEHRDRCTQIAEWHASLAAEYHRNSGGRPGMEQTAAWHRHMRDVFAAAAETPWAPLPVSRPFPPSGWDPAPANEPGP